MVRINWVLFDADNTLWSVEHLYNHARTELCRYISKFGYSYRKIEYFQQECDAQLHEKMGYSSERFPKSFVETLLHFRPEASSADISKVKSLAQDVFEGEVELAEGVGQVLITIKPYYKIGILTAGEEYVQRKRLQLFPFSSEFDAIKIVSKKSSETLKAFCKEEDVPIPRSWMIGDSINSDIIPARSIGLNVIHLKFENWHHVEGRYEKLPDGVPSIEKLEQILDFIPLG